MCIGNSGNHCSFGKNCRHFLDSVSLFVISFWNETSYWTEIKINDSLCYRGNSNFVQYRHIFCCNFVFSNYRQASIMYFVGPYMHKKYQLTLPQIQCSVVEGHFAQDCTCAEWIHLWHVQQTHSGFHRHYTQTSPKFMIILKRLKFHECAS